MRELVSSQCVERAFLVLAVVGPALGLVVGAALGVRERRVGPKALAGLLIGALGTVVCGLWHLYNAITDALGLDSLANLGLQMVMFAVIGVALAFAALGISTHIKRPRSG